MNGCWMTTAVPFQQIACGLLAHGCAPLNEPCWKSAALPYVPVTEQTERQRAVPPLSVQQRRPPQSASATHVEHWPALHVL